ncbi:hypothetical protein N7462_001934 [Penicillium macrosclerotiorum]|uniref:uncharacterized protein n=1 Tax=Penicillium macrosclerotiorum TaxID=303699 RepID=UPI002547F46B|nr:uncharacterized protein N7462_001934 [Penicillium macrosclerotiorum]KAJ5692511.1 hypothetical protein N7462_001934 [Penicillium macrosclerotiorum]
MPQDMPPVGGYAQVQYKRNVPARGFKPFYYMAGMHLIMAYGFYRYFQGVREQRYVPRTGKCLSVRPRILQLETEIRTEHRELAREKMWGRLYLAPLLQAEEDRDQVRRYYADKAREKELLGTESKIYNSDRFVRPTFVYTPSKITQ